MKAKPKLYTLNGERKTLREWAASAGLLPATLRNRLYRGESLSTAISRPPDHTYYGTERKKRKQGPHQRVLKKLLGRKIDELTVTGHETGPGWRWILRCSCGAEVRRSTSNVLGSIRDSTTEGAKCMTAQHRGGLPPVETLPENYVWLGMRSRCNDPNNRGYRRYGGRGIKVCAGWNDPNTGFLAFIADMGRRPSNKHSINRRDNNGDYTPENCHWATPKEQARNRRSSRFVTVGSETRTLAEWSEQTGRDADAIARWLDRGLPAEQAVFGKLPTRAEQAGARAKHYQFRGQRKTLNEIAQETGVNPKTLGHRLLNGLTVEEATRPEGVARSDAGLYDYQGQKWSVAQLARKAGLPPRAVRGRLNHGWTVEEAVETPISPR